MSNIEHISDRQVQSLLMEGFIASTEDFVDEPKREEKILPTRRIADRFVLVSFVGEGGMGQVWRAKDLELGCTVALKFLPDRLRTQQHLLESLRNEVQKARRVVHPNVCRVFDLLKDEAGNRFVVMEYIDGDTLVKIHDIMGGQIPRERALAIARQLCWGLEAMHQQGVLHCDLKPANVMLDSRGVVRITDFGIARFIEQPADGRIAGTYQYMSPEQLEGQRLTIKSDLYSLGLTLYELFSSECLFPPVPRAEQIRRRMDLQLSRVGHELDREVEKSIQKCLEFDPDKRPAHALSLGASLARAAGEIPTPDEIAAEEGEKLSPPKAIFCFAGILIALGIFILMNQHHQLLERIAPPLPPAVLEYKAQSILKELGYHSHPQDHASGFGFHYSYLAHVSSNETPTPWRDLESIQPPVIYFWYRQSPQYLHPNSFFADPLVDEPQRGRVSLTDPPQDVAGMVSVRLDPHGHLHSLRALPDSTQPTNRKLAEPDWPSLLNEELLGFDLFDSKNFRVVSATHLPPMPFDHHQAWEGRYPQSGTPIHVEAASFQGRLVFFEISGPSGEWAAEPVTATITTMKATSTTQYYFNAMRLTWLALLAGAAILAWRNLKRGKGDRRGAFRLAFFIFIVQMIAWVLQADHLPTRNEIHLLMMGLAWALFWSVLFWLYYIALEPFVRESLPDSLSSWNRLLQGRWSDPLVGQGVLIGTLHGIIFAILIQQLNTIVPALLGLGAPVPPGTSDSWLMALEGPGQWLSTLLLALPRAIEYGLFFGLFFLLLLQRLLRDPRLAIAGFIIFYTILIGIGTGHAYTSWLFSGLTMSIAAFTLVRFGLLAGVVMLFVQDILRLPLTIDHSSWYAGISTLTIAVVIALAVHGFLCSLQRPQETN